MEKQDKAIDIKQKFDDMMSRTDADDAKDRLSKLKALITHDDVPNASSAEPKPKKSKKAKTDIEDATEETGLSRTKRNSMVLSTKFSWEQQRFIELFIPMRFNITDICAEVGINRKTFYDWSKNNADFAQEIENLREYIVDLAEQTLVNAMQSGDKDAAKFMLKALSHRYKDKIDLTSNGQTVGSIINIVVPPKNE